MPLSLFLHFAESSPSHSSVTTHSHPAALFGDNDEFSDFQGPVDASASIPLPSSSSSSTTNTFGLSSQTHVHPSSHGSVQDDDEFSDFVQGPVNNIPSSDFQHSSQGEFKALFPSSHSLPQSLPTSVSITNASQHCAVNSSSSSTFQGNSSFVLLTTFFLFLFFNIHLINKQLTLKVFVCFILFTYM